MSCLSTRVRSAAHPAVSRDAVSAHAMPARQRPPTRPLPAPGPRRGAGVAPVRWGGVILRSFQRGSAALSSSSAHQLAALEETAECDGGGSEKSQIPAVFLADIAKSGRKPCNLCNLRRRRQPPL